MSRPQMTLGEFIRALERQDPNELVKYDFAHFGPTTLDSYRGYYDHLALGYCEHGYQGHGTRNPGYDYPKVRDLLAHCRGAVGKVFTGYKGGDYRMTVHTPLWVANRGGMAESTAIVDVVDSTYVIIVTGHRG